MSGVADFMYFLVKEAPGNRNRGPRAAAQHFLFRNKMTGHSI